MILDERTLSLLVVALVAAVVLLGVWVAWLQRSEAVLRRRLRRVLPQGESGGIDEILDRQLKSVESLSERVDALNKLHHELEHLSQRTLQKVAVIRYNPFSDTGGDQSFAISFAVPSPPTAMTVRTPSADASRAMRAASPGAGVWMISTLNPDPSSSRARSRPTRAPAPSPAAGFTIASVCSECRLITMSARALS